jgi:hypothetical protein
VPWGTAREGRLGKAAGEGIEGAESRDSREADCAVRGVEASGTEAGGHEEESGGAGDAVEIILIYCSERRSL